MADDATAAGPRQGGCACGAVRFSVDVTGTEMDACHCGRCRKWSGGPFMAVEVQNLSVAPEAPLGVWDSSEWGERLFCRECGSSLGFRMKDGPMVVLSAFVFDTPLTQPLVTEIFIDDKPDTYAFAGDTKKMTGAEVMAAFGGE
ncbi:GFA family protein [Acuticoccus mangrovi]|uniref:GFA family protein n=1 Tax=Acuticoccus mangrovi TaxID=2796142 RepID=A0A934ILA5_9HYPH|nr:GFA family protein [Acuticoccus mangrovi]MBJ3774398.1 GFA family protein [Acuticoccus mangrovi]